MVPLLLPPSPLAFIDFPLFLFRLQHLRADVNLAWPTAEIAVMGARGAVNIIHRGKSEEEITKEIDDYEAKFCTPVRLRCLCAHQLLIPA